MSVRILIAEDEILIAREIERTLHKLGYAVTAIAIDGESAVEKAVETKPDLILMDILMPGEMDGIGAAHCIRDRLQIPVVYLTAYGDTDTLNRAKATEPFGYILKPFQPQELNATIQIALTRHQLEQHKLEALRQSINTSLSHEINTPLSGISVVIKFLLKDFGMLPQDEVLELLECIHTSANRLDRVCQNFLLHTKLELMATDAARVAQLRKSLTSSTKFLVEEFATRKAKDAGRTNDLQLTIQDCTVQISETNLIKIIDELLDNALKFSPPETEITIQGGCADDMFILSVSDQGRGLTPDELTQLGAFVQFNRKLQEQQGLGLGLSLVQRLAELHDGSLTVNSTIHQGTTATVKLPLINEKFRQME